MTKNKDKTDSTKKKRKSAALDEDTTEAPPQAKEVRFQVEERPAKRRFVLPEGFAPVRARCSVDPKEVAAGKQELWLIQLPTSKAMQMLAAAGTLEVDLRTGAVTAPGAPVPPVATVHDREGAKYGLVPETSAMARQVVAVCPLGDEAGAAQAVPVSRRLTLVRMSGPGGAAAPLAAGVAAGMPEDEAAALARLDASLAAMEAARKESATIMAAEAGTDVTWAAVAAGAAAAPAAAAAAAGQAAAPGPAGRGKEKEKEKHKAPAATPVAAATPATGPDAKKEKKDKSEKKEKKEKKDKEKKEKKSEKKEKKKEKKDKKDKKKDTDSDSD
ncbi:hypothetical protein HYH02_008286 [Chlamydomonas schloesseri]|uniref:Uncharacterized protein n=1 Tax=Chlamydomonas schloesseri TaxID=2026947 RepID=A0A836B453_9CHLO|nr:hypothetical protein HYH02_008286 [Chlamydomonas schloesseri]|eukprot:KAG2446724.1 hypothetical protein HYH02_008286 [Chlamydomonas schloesseri]